MASLAAQTLDLTAGIPSVTWNACAGGGDDVPANGKIVLIFRNTNAATRTVTFVAVGRASDGYTITSPTIVVPVTTGFSIFYPRDTGLFGNASGRIGLTYSAVTNLDVAVIQLP